MAPRSAARATTPRRTTVGAGPVKWPAVIVLAIAYAAVALLLLYVLIQFWPKAAPADPSCVDCRFFNTKLTLSRERNFFLIVAIAGALGATVHGLRSAFRYIGERILYQSWLVMYFFLPIIGATLGTLVYIVLRAGLIPSTGASQADPFGFAAVSGLVGLFTAQAAEKLKEVFETLFLRPKAGGDSVEGLEPPANITFEPASGREGDHVRVSGTGFDDQTEIMFGTTNSSSEFISDVELGTTVPAGLGPGKVRVTATNASGSATSTDEFEVLA